MKGLSSVGPVAALIIEMGSKFAVPTRHVSTGVTLKRLRWRSERLSTVETMGTGPFNLDSASEPYN
jgi:hypothetical protein